MATELRKTGISAVGDVPWGTHFCHFYETKQDLLDNVIPYFKAGLESKEFCLWVVSNDNLITVEEAKAALEQAVPDLHRRLSDENIEILNGLEAYLEENVFSLERITLAWDEKLKRALARGYDGMRVSGDMFRPGDREWRDFCAYEKQLNDSISGRPMTVLCTYPLAKSGAAEILDVVETHHFSLASLQGERKVIETPELILARAEIKRLNEELERRVIQPTGELRESEERFRQLADNIGEVLWLYTPDYSKVLYISPAYESVWGRTCESLQREPQSFLDAVHPNDRARVEETVRREREQGVNHQYRVVRPDGTVRWVWDRGFPIKDKDGRVYRIAGIARDITERKQAEEELRRITERLRLATSAASLGIWDWDVVKDELVWDDAMYALHGICKADFSGAYDAWAKALAPEDFDRANDDLQAALLGEREFAPEYRIVWPDRSIHFIKAAAQTFRDEDGRPVRMVGLNYDITARKLTEERITLLQTITIDVGAAQDLPSALEVVLRRVCEKTGWALGQAWVPRQNGMGLDCCPAWFAASASLEEFRAFSTYITLSPGSGLPGRVWASRQPAWIRDVTQDSNFPRAEAAMNVGLKAALGVPILSGDEVIAVLEFFLSEPCEEDERLVNVIAAVAAQIGLVIERKRAEEKLRWSEERLRLLLDSTAEGIFGVDLEGRFTFCNASSLRLLGYDRPAELLGKDMHALISHTRADGTQYPMEECPVVQSLQNATSAFADADVFWRKDTASFPAEYWSFPIFQENKHIGAVVTFLDITERKLAEESLRLSEERFAKAFQASPEPITIFRHRDGVSLEVNERWQSVYGYTREEAVGCTSLDLNLMIRPEDRDRLRGLLERQHSVRDFEVDFKTKQDEIRHISLSAEQIVINNELCNIFLHRDITERKKAQEKLKQSESQLAEAQRVARVGYWERDIGTGEIFCSDETYRIFGLQPQDPIESFAERIHHDDRSVQIEATARMLRGEHYDVEYRVVTPDGEVRIVHSQGHAISDESGRPSRGFGTVQDVTQLKRAEEQLKATSEQLRALSESLRTAREEEGTRIARELHDELGSALTSLKWDIEGIDKLCSESGYLADWSKLRDKIKGMLGVVDATINTVIKISTELRPSILDDLGLLAAIEWQAQQFEARTGIACQFDSLLDDPDLSREKGTAIFRILQEALTNILRHSQSTRVRIMVEEVDGEFVLEVHDNGRGIKEEERAGPRSLGLMGMRERANIAGGRIEIAGTAGKGTVLTLRIPVSSQAVA